MRNFLRPRSARCSETFNQRDFFFVFLGGDFFLGAALGVFLAADFGVCLPFLPRRALGGRASPASATSAGAAFAFAGLRPFCEAWLFRAPRTRPPGLRAILSAAHFTTSSRRTSSMLVPLGIVTFTEP